MKEVEINGVVNVPNSVNFWDAFIQFVESLGGSFGGSIVED